MPCNSEYMEQNNRERELQRSAKLLVYLQKKLGKKPDAWAVKEAANYYAKDERSVTELCATLRSLTPSQCKSIVYNAYDETARDLATWWEHHQAADKKREEKEKAEKTNKVKLQLALSKLTKEDLELILDNVHDLFVEIRTGHKIGGKEKA